MAIDFIFSILNFLSIIVVAIYVFYKYILPSVLKAFEEDKTSLKALFDQENDLITFDRELDQSILDQNELGKRLSLKFKEWQSVVQLEKEEKFNQSIKYNSEINNRLKIQSDNYKTQKIKEQLKPDILKNLEINLNNYFEDPDNVDKYFDSILSNMNKRVNLKKDN